MDARLTDEQQRIQETAEEFIESEGGIEFARRRMEGDREVVDELWGQLADLDYTGITVPVDHGGFGEGMVYLTALLEVAGKYALPGPLPETAAVAVPPSGSGSRGSRESSPDIATLRADEDVHRQRGDAEQDQRGDGGVAEVALVLHAPDVCRQRAEAGGSQQ